MNESQKKTLQRYQEEENKLRSELEVVKHALELNRRDLIEAEQSNAMLQAQLHDQDEDIAALTQQIQYWRNRTRHWMVQLQKVV